MNKTDHGKVTAEQEKQMAEHEARPPKVEASQEINTEAGVYGKVVKQ